LKDSAIILETCTTEPKRIELRDFGGLNITIKKVLKKTFILASVSKIIDYFSVCISNN